MFGTVKGRIAGALQLPCTIIHVLWEAIENMYAHHIHLL